VGSGMISVIVLSKNNGDTLDRCLKSIIESDGDKEVIVVDARSTDNTPQILRKYSEKIKVVYDEGKGIGIARNLGVRNSKGDIICFVDADAFVSKDHFVRIKNFLDKNPEVGVVHVSCSMTLPAALSFVGKMEEMLRHARKIMGLEVISSEVMLAGGCFMAFKREVFNDAGGFWDFPPYGADDNDFSMKALVKGWKIGIVETDSWHPPRENFRELFMEIWGWAKGKACWVKKWGNHPFARRMYEKSRTFRILGGNLLCYTLLAYLASPLTALRYVKLTKSPSLYLFCILRQYLYLLGFLWGLATWARGI